jgi:hypothetical protein
MEPQEMMMPPDQMGQMMPPEMMPPPNQGM